jgi:hypothetical protein
VITSYLALLVEESDATSASLCEPWLPTVIEISIFVQFENFYMYIEMEYGRDLNRICIKICLSIAMFYREMGQRPSGAAFD